MKAFKCDVCGKFYEMDHNKYPNRWPIGGRMSKLVNSSYVNGIRLMCGNESLPYSFDLCPECMEKIHDLFKFGNCGNIADPTDGGESKNDSDN